MSHANNSTDRISLQCPACQARLRAARTLLGRSCPCPRCREQVVVRATAPSDADIALFDDRPKAR
jgi:uncharacterized paraquat-inducible protein A